MAMTTTKQDERLPEDIELLLPWHAAGTLSRRDAARVEQALANDQELAARYELVREELGEAIRLNESLGAPSARAMEQLFAKIDAESARAPKPAFNISMWLTNFVAGFSPRTLAYGATAAALAIVLQAGILAGVFVQERTVGPQLASYQQSEPTGPGAYVRVRFKPQATAAEITAFLKENNAFVVGGPGRDNGFFEVRVSEQSMTPAELSAVAKKLAANPVVDFTVPSAQ
jgi:anti-sigma-K factor RskA